MNARQILIEAASLIETRGHAKGWFEDSKGCLCATGAIGMAATGDPVGYSDDIPPDVEAELSRAFRAAHAEVGAMRNGDGRIVPWNDAPERTASEVVSMLRRAAERV